MRQFFFSVATSLVITGIFTGGNASAQVQASTSSGASFGEPRVAGQARFEVSESHQLRVQRAREETAHRLAVQRYHESIGYDSAHPVVNMSGYSFQPSLTPRRNSFSRYIFTGPEYVELIPGDRYNSPLYYW